MKSIHLLFVLIAVFSFTSCDSGIEGEEKTDSNEPETNEASNLTHSDAVYGVIDEDGDFHEITASELTDHYNKHLDIGKHTSYNDPEVIENESTDSEHNYLLSTTSKNGEVSIIAEVQEVEDYDQGLALAITGTTCACMSTDPLCLTDSSCNPEYESGTCKCSPCGGDCTKTATITTDIASYFLK